MSKNLIITIDGPAGSGKSTVSRIVAEKLDLLYLDTGAMYRAVALEAHKRGLGPQNGRELKEMCLELDLNIRSHGNDSRIYIGGEDVTSEIRTPEMDMLSSAISAVKEVREAMTGLQRKIGRQGGLVAEGRDMGAVVFPDADHKFFLIASPEVRVERRYAERLERGESVSRDVIGAELRKRDKQDETRPIAPLRPAKDAIIIDTTLLGIEQVVGEILEKAGKKKV